MPAISHDGQTIRYDVIGEGPPVVLQHGMLAEGETWTRHGFTEPLARDHQVILIDSLAHGRSSKPIDLEPYRLPNRVAHVLAVMDEVGAERAHFVGYSMGGWIGCGIAEVAPERLASLAIGGWDVDHGLAAAKAQFQELLGMELTAGTLIAGGAAVSPEIRATVEQGVPEAFERCWEAIESFGGSRDAIAAAGVPVLMYCGTRDAYHDNMRAAAAALPRATFVSIPDRDHLVAMTDSAAVVPSLLELFATPSPFSER